MESFKFFSQAENMGHPVAYISLYISLGKSQVLVLNCVSIPTYIKMVKAGNFQNVRFL